jgi:glycosyltransferase involved in cell wall biosynthesis
VQRPQPSLFEGPDAGGLFRVVSRFPAFSRISNGDLFSLSLSNKTAPLTHGLHRFAAKYIPQIPAWAMEEFADRNTVVLDPFCGSGTTLVEALHRCGKSIGIDCDPLACLIAGAKTAAVRSARIRDLGQRLRQAWHGPADRLAFPMPGLVNFTHWFSEAAWGGLQSLLAAIQDLECSEEERRFLLCVFSSVVRWVSNADDQTQKTYVSSTLKKRPPGVTPTFWKAFDRALAGLRELELYRLPDAQAAVMRGDASDIRLPEASIDLIVTSPPYLDSVDYMYNFMLEYFWLGPILGVKDRQTFNRMRRGVIGAKNPLHKRSPHLPQCLTDLISESDVLPARLPATRAYCHNMARHFASASRVMKPKGRYVLVVGNSQTKKGILPIHDSLIRLAADAGLAFEKAFAYRIRRHYMKFPRKGRGGIITMDWVIVLRKSDGRTPYPERLPLPDFTVRADEVAN